jgi:16S rRNA (uracil1498-N3)-methyltransferase
VSARVFAPDAEASGQVIALSRDEAVHVGKVLRLGRGDAVRVFDGRGAEWDATIAAATATTVSVVLGPPAVAAAEPRVRYTLAAAVLKGDGTDDAIRDAVMMGVARVQPFVSARAETRLSTLVSGHRHGRWQRIAVASAKQCGRAVVPAVDAAVSFETLIAEGRDPLRVILVEPTQGAAGAPVALGALSAPAAVTLAVGPEGGWTDEELRTAGDAGWRPVRLGARTLRAAAMPLVALAACQAVWADA